MFTIDSTGFINKANVFLNGLNPKADALMREHAGGMAVEMAFSTPPFVENGDSGTANKLGKAALTANMLSFVIPREGGKRNAFRILRKYRATGTAKRRVVVSQESFDNYFNQKVHTVGYTAGGWLPAVNELLGSGELPGWITVVPGPGSVSIKKQRDGLVIEFSNDVPWLDKLDVNDRFERVMIDGEGYLKRDLKLLFERESRSSGF